MGLDEYLFRFVVVYLDDIFFIGGGILGSCEGGLTQIKAESSCREDAEVRIWGWKGLLFGVRDLLQGVLYGPN